jgi:hypothetical protein
VSLGLYGGSRTQGNGGANSMHFREGMTRQRNMRTFKEIIFKL